MPTIGLIEMDEPKMCLVFCGEGCTCGNFIKNQIKAMNIIQIPKSNVRNVPIKKRKRKR